MKVEDLNVVILAYSRPNTFEQVLQACARSVPFVKVVMDCPTNKDIELKQEQIESILRSSGVDYLVRKRQENYGLVRSVLTTISEELESREHVILLEDDCVPSQEFFDFVSHSIEKYKEDHSISSICGTITDCKFNPWGWATWRHKWNYEYFTKEQIENISNLHPDLLDFLAHNNVEDSIWSLNWLASQYKNNTSAVFPDRNLIKNIGLNDTGVHSAEKGYTKWLISRIQAQ